MIDFYLLFTYYIKSLSFLKNFIKNSINLLLIYQSLHQLVNNISKIIYKCNITLKFFSSHGWEVSNYLREVEIFWKKYIIKWENMDTKKSNSLKIEDGLMKSDFHLYWFLYLNYFSNLFQIYIFFDEIVSNIFIDTILTL